VVLSGARGSAGSASVPPPRAQSESYTHALCQNFFLIFPRPLLASKKAKTENEAMPMSAAAANIPTTPMRRFRVCISPGKIFLTQKRPRAHLEHASKNVTKTWKDNTLHKNFQVWTEFGIRGSSSEP